MNQNRLIQQLRQEIKANPGKASLLGVLLVVALYYWIPLVAKWCRPSEPLADLRAQPIASPSPNQKETKQQFSSGGEPSPNLAESAPSASPSNGFPGWDQLVQWREEDPRTRPIPWPAEGRDPFQPAVETLPIKTAMPGGKEKSILQATPAPPESLQVELTSIIIGPRRRMAIINGQPYQEGDTFLFKKDASQWEFRLSRILPNKILLQWEDRYYEVHLPTSTVNMQLQFISSSEGENP